MADAQPQTAKLSRRMSAQDAAFIYGESRSGPLHIGSINIFGGRIDYDELIAHMNARMHLLPRYRQRLAFVPLNLAHATLEDDPDFDLRNHLREVSLPDEVDERALLAAAMRELVAAASDVTMPTSTFSAMWACLRASMRNSDGVCGMT